MGRIACAIKLLINRSHNLAIHKFAENIGEVSTHMYEYHVTSAGYMQEKLGQNAT